MDAELSADQFGVAGVCGLIVEGEASCLDDDPLEEDETVECLSEASTCRGGGQSGTTTGWWTLTSRRRRIEVDMPLGDVIGIRDGLDAGFAGEVLKTTGEALDGTTSV